MNNIIDLVKVSFIDSFNLNRMFKKDKLLTNIIFGILLLILIGFSFFMFGFIYYASVVISPPEDVVKVFLTMVLTVSSGFLIIVNLSRVSSLIYKSRDFDLLMSLPIKTNEIIISKVITLLISNYASLLLTVIPAYYIGFKNLSIGALFYFELSLVILFSPFFIISLFSLISYLINRIFNKIRIKNVFKALLGLFAFTLYMYFVMNLSGDDEQLMNMVVLLTNKLKYINPLSLLAIEGLANKPLLTLLYIVINILSLVGFIYFISYIYLKINTSTVTKSNNKVMKRQVKSETNIVTLTKLEFKKYFDKPMYVLNTLTGKIMLLIFTFVIFTPELLGEIEGLNDEVILSVVLIGLMLFTLTMTSKTTSTFSVEGKNLWLYKSLPIKEKDIIISKMLVDIIPALIVGAISITMFSVMVKPNVLIIIVMLISLVLISSFNASLGILLNLKFPKLNWTKEAEAYKQGKAVLLHMLISFVQVGIYVGLIIISMNFLNPVLTFVMIVSYLLLINILVYVILKFKAHKLYIKL